MGRSLIFAIAALIPLLSAAAADLNGVQMPDTRVADGTLMRLNGIGLRTYSVLGIPIYVAGLYLERRSDDPETILHSVANKLLDIRFLRDVGAEDARKAWREGFERNCRAPCNLDPQEAEQFFAAVPQMHQGDETTMLFSSKGVEVTLNGRALGDITDLHFAEVMLATFIGPEPATARLKRQLLGARN